MNVFRTLPEELNDLPVMAVDRNPRDWTVVPAKVVYRSPLGLKAAQVTVAWHNQVLTVVQVISSRRLEQMGFCRSLLPQLVRTDLVFPQPSEYTRCHSLEVVLAHHRSASHQPSCQLQPQQPYPLAHLCRIDEDHLFLGHRARLARIPALDIHLCPYLVHRPCRHRNIDAASLGQMDLFASVQASGQMH